MSIDENCRGGSDAEFCGALDVFSEKLLCLRTVKQCLNLCDVDTEFLGARLPAFVKFFAAAEDIIKVPIGIFSRD